MKKVHFSYGNFRYLLFTIDDQYFLLDRSPRFLIGYIFPPINWLFYQRVHPITIEDYQRITQKNDKAKKIMISASVFAGLGVLIYNIFRVNNISIIPYFETKIPRVFSIVLLTLGLCLAYCLARGGYFLSEKSMSSLLGDEVRKTQYYKFTPEKINFKQIIGFIALIWGLNVFMGVYYLYSTNLLFWFVTIFLSFLCFIGINVAFGKETWQIYKLVDILEKTDDTV